MAVSIKPFPTSASLPFPALQISFIRPPLTTPEIFSRFVVWMFLLELINTVWIGFIVVIRTSGFKKRLYPPPPYEWLFLNALVTAFLLVYFLYPIYIIWDVYPELLGVLFARVLVDYRVAWKSVYRIGQYSIAPSFKHQYPYTQYDERRGSS